MDPLNRHPHRLLPGVPASGERIDSTARLRDGDPDVIVLRETLENIESPPPALQNISVEGSRSRKVPLIRFAHTGLKTCATQVIVERPVPPRDQLTEFMD